MSTEKDAVKQVILDAYIKGIHTIQNKSIAEKGFHPDFKMLVQQEDSMNSIGLDGWFDRIETLKADNPEMWSLEPSYEFLSVDVKAEAASVKMDVFRGGKFFATDYLLLYKFSDGWKIVSKTFTFKEA